MYVEKNFSYFGFFGFFGIGIYLSSRSEFARRNWRRSKMNGLVKHRAQNDRGDKIRTILNKSAFLLGTQTVSGIKEWKLRSTKSNRDSCRRFGDGTIEPKTRLKRLSFSSKNRRLAPFQCREEIFVSGGGCVVQTLSLNGSGTLIFLTNQDYLDYA